MKWIRQLLCPHFWVELETIKTTKYGVLIGWHVDRYCSRCGRIERNEWKSNE